LHYDDLLVISEAALVILSFRMAYAGGVQPQSSFRRHIVAGLWLGIAAWIAGALLHAWVPLWQILLIGLAAGAGVFVLQPRLKLATRPAADLFVIAALGTLSVVPIAWVRVAVAAAVFMAAGYTLDRLTRRLTLRAQRILWVMPVALTALLGRWVTQEDDFGSRLLARDPLFPMRFALAAPLPGERVSLPSGAAAWLLTVPGDKSVGTAILLHGNNPGAARQPAAVALQGALLRAGFDAMTVEMPGYGASNPSPESALDSWDPTVGPREALAFIDATHRTASAPTIIVGHSAGVDVALQWLKSGVTAQEAYLFSGTIGGPPLSAEDAAKLFNRQRRIRCCVPDQTVKQINDRFYAGADRYAAELPPTHALIQFVNMEIEYPDVAADRHLLYAAISAPKAACSFAGMTHYMNTLALRRFTLVDTRTVKRLARLFSAPETSADPTRCGD
jgi:pimeloyl-ACP methyl ester carboxylesterase